MATLTALAGKLNFKLDSGETKGGKPVYRNLGIANIDANADTDDIGAVAEKIVGLVSLTVDQISLTRTDLIDL